MSKLERIWQLLGVADASLSALFSLFSAPSVDFSTLMMLKI